MSADHVNIEYLPITSTLTKIRVYGKSLPPIQNEIQCYPITNVTKPIDLFAPFPKQPQTFVPVIPPNPPKRVSSKDSTNLEDYKKTHLVIDASKNFDRNSTITGPNHNHFPTLVRSRSTSGITSSSNTEKNVRRPRISSLSPVSRKIDKHKPSSSPIAFGRSISKERTFAEEKKKQEERLPMCRRVWTASTNILRDPFLQSPKDVREAVRTTYKSPQTRERLTTSSSTRKTPSGNTIKTSAMTYAKDKLMKNSVTNDEKTIKMTTIELKSKKNPNKPIVIKSNLLKSSVSTETNLVPHSKETTKTSSNISLARTNSSYSIDSNSMKRRIKNRPYTIKSAAKAIAPPVTITNKSRKIKIETKLEPKSIRDQKSGNLESYTRKIKSTPYRSGFERSSSFIVVQGEKKDEQIGTKSDKIFQNLYIRKFGENATRDDAIDKTTDMQKKTHFWNTIPRSTNGIKKQSTGVYLAQKQPVSRSKFKEYDVIHSRQARSLSPYHHKLEKSYYIDRTNNSYNFYDDIDGAIVGRGEFGFDYHYQKRSTSEPRSITYLQNKKTAASTTKTGESTGQEKKERPFSPTREIRSPSSRRIQSFREQNKAERSQNRYRTIDLTRRHSLSDDESHLDVYLHQIQQSEKFKDLNRFYSKVERVGELERTTSNIDLHPIRRENELIDFDVWRQVRNYERAEKELHTLVDKLKKDEREKDFLFRPKYPEDIKWNHRHESGLRIKEKSVEDLKNLFIEKSLQSELEHSGQRPRGPFELLWSRNSVLDLASNMVHKYNTYDNSVSSNTNEERFGLSRNLISTLSKDQISKIKNQLTEIYSNNNRMSSKAEKPPDHYIINTSDARNTKSTSLLVRSNSLVGEKELLGSVLQRQENRLKSNIKADSICAVDKSYVNVNVDRYDSIQAEDEKRKLLQQQLSNEMRTKLKERSEKVLQPRETRGAMASGENINTSSSADPKPTCVSQTKQKSEEHKPLLVKKTRSDQKKISKKNDLVKQSLVSFETQSYGRDYSKSETIAEQPSEKIKEKVKYFEEKRCEKTPKTIYLPREDSSLDEEEVIRGIEENIKARREQLPKNRLYAKGLSTSDTDLKEIFGEKESVRNLIESRSPSPIKNGTMSKNEEDAASIERVFRSRSISPISDSVHSILKKSHNYDGQLAYQYSMYKPPRSPTIFASPPRRFRSDPTLNDTIESRSKIVVKSSEVGNVSYYKHKFEMNKAMSHSHGRPCVRSLSSPTHRVAFKKEDRLMPHIDIISKTIALKDAINRSSTPKLSNKTIVSTGEVDKIRHKFETQTSNSDRVSLIGQMYTSSPDISELRDISNYLSSTWIAHKYSKQDDNARSATEPEKEPTNQEIKRKASRSGATSPIPQKNINDILRPLYDIFADQKTIESYDPMKHRPKYRYVPVDKRIEAEYLWRRLKQKIDYHKNVKASVHSKG